MAIRSFNISTCVDISQQSDETKLAFIKIHDNSFDHVGGKGMKSHEIESLFCFSEKIEGNINNFQNQGYFLGLSCLKGQGLCEEFDILRFSDKSVLNIELKSSLPDGGLLEVEKQLRNHRMLLSHVNSNTYVWTYVSSTDTLFTLDSGKQLIDSTVEALISQIEESFTLENQLHKINVSDITISPYTDPERFSKHLYYLTQEQEQKKKEILKTSENRICLVGGPGTGKSLLLLDIAKELKNNGKKVLIVFSAVLRKKINIRTSIGIDIIDSPELKDEKKLLNKLENYEVVLVDEAHRLYDISFDVIHNRYHGSVIYSIDGNQVLHSDEKNRDIETIIISDNSVKTFKLNGKIRSNEVIFEFTNNLLNLKYRGKPARDYDSVFVDFFTDKSEARKYIEHKCNYENYISIEQTEYTTKTNNDLKRRRKSNLSNQTHYIIGLEYENIIVVIDEHFTYKNGLLISTYPEYYPYIEDKMLYQALTRAKKYITIVVINNPLVYAEIQNILTKYLVKD